jgi:hypothetical protein
MNSELIGTLKSLRNDPARVVDLYRQLYQGTFIAIVQSGTENEVSLMSFLTYDTRDTIKELPIFTRQEFVINFPVRVTQIFLDGHILFPRLLDIIQTGICEVAVDPLQPHGIRLKKEMILGMISEYGKRN